MKIAIKPTSSIRLARRSIDKEGRATTVETHGRHDPCVGIRATPIAEAMLLLTLIDHALLHRAQNADVSCSTPQLAARAPGAEEPTSARAAKDRSADQTGKIAGTSARAQSRRSATAVENPEPDEA